MIPPKEKYLLISDYIAKRDWLIYLMVNGDFDDCFGSTKVKDIAEWFKVNPDRIYKIYERVGKFLTK